MMIKIIVGEVITVLLVYTQQTGFTIAEKESLFYDSLQNLVQTVDGLETLLICGDFNGHIWKTALGYEGIYGIYGGYGFGKRDIDGERTLEFAVANNLVMGNPKFVKKDNHLIVYQSCGCSSQVDYILLQCKKFHLVIKTLRLFQVKSVSLSTIFWSAILNWRLAKTLKQQLYPNSEYGNLKALI